MQAALRKALPALALFHASFALAAPPVVTQTNAQQLAQDLNRKGSDDSMESSTTSAMKALMHFANSEMPSAVSNGMTAYGKYRNSENLDKLGDQNILNEVKMASMGGGPVSGVSNARTGTSFRRLDPAFLRKGEAGKIADEFERQSGMKREDFLKELAAVSEKKISRRDPQLMDKVLSRFESFAAKIPNQEFRKKVEAGINRVPATVRNGLISKAISKFSGFFGGGEPAPAAGAAVSSVPAPASTTSTTPPAAEAPAAEASVAAADNMVPTQEGDRLPSAVGGSRLPPIDQRSDMLASTINAAIHTQSVEPTIFDIVSRKYREFTAVLGKKPPQN